MATTFVDYTGDGNATKPFSFPSYQVEDVKVEVDGVVKTVSTHYNITSYTTTGGGNVVFTSGNIPVSPEAIRIYRDTDIQTNTGEAEPKATYAAGSSVKAADLNNNQKQVLYAIAEEKDQTITAQDIKDGAITSVKISDGTIVNADVNASAAIAGTKVAPDFGSQNIATTGTVNGVSTTELAILDGATVSTAELNKLDGVTASTSEINILDGVTSTTTELNILDGVTASTAEINKLDGVTASTSELNILDGVTATATELNIIDGVTATTAELNYVDGVTSNVQTQLDGKQPLDSELTELATMGSGTASSLADLSSAEVQTLDGITASTTELNLLDGKSIVTTISGSATDVQIPSAQAVNERIVEVVTEVGGFVPIANETSFPTTNPDINDGAGTIISIKALASNLTSNGSGVATIANGAGSGNTVTINGMANSDTIEAGKGILVETTTTLHTYTFHREVIDPTGVTNAQTLVNDFNDRYQISGSAPSNHPDGSALQDGDLWFDTSANIMKVYDLGNTQYDAVTSVGDFKLLTVVPDGATSGSPTFDGNIVSYDLRDGSNAASITSVGQLLVSLNGVIQKPNAGTYSASNEGFHLEGTNGIKFCTAPPSGSSLFITLIGAATSIGTPSDNTVSEAKLTSDSVSEAKLKVSNSPTDGYFLSAQSGNSGGLTWAQVSSDLVSDSSPQLGAELDSNGYDIKLTDGEKLLLHNYGQLKTKTGATNAVVSGLTGYVLQNSTVLDSSSYDLWLSSTGKKITFGTSDSQTHEVMRVQCAAVGASQHGFVNLNYVTANAGQNASSSTKLSTTATGITVTGTVAATSYTGDGSNLTGIASTVAGGAIYENSQTISSSHTIPSGSNGMSAGPVTINNGISLTISNGSTYTIV